MNKEIERRWGFVLVGLLGILLGLMGYTVIVYITNFINFPYMGFVFVGLSIWFTIYRIKKG